MVVVISDRYGLTICIDFGAQAQSAGALLSWEKVVVSRAKAVGETMAALIPAASRRIFAVPNLISGKSLTQNGCLLCGAQRQAREKSEARSSLLQSSLPFLSLTPLDKDAELKGGNRSDQVVLEPLSCHTF